MVVHYDILNQDESILGQQLQNALNMTPLVPKQKPDFPRTFEMCARLVYG